MLAGLDPLIKLPHEDNPPAIPVSFAENKGKSDSLVAERQARWRKDSVRDLFTNCGHLLEDPEIVSDNNAHFVILDSFMAGIRGYLHIVLSSERLLVAQ